MPEKLPINAVTIEDICECYGFPYRCADDGRHFATVGEQEVEIKFREDGSLPRGRHAFVGAARKASEAFAADYPPATQSKRKKGGAAGVANAKQAMKELRNLLKAFDLDHFDEVMGLVADARDEKRKEMQFREERKVLQAQIEKLEKDMGTFTAYGCDAPDVLAGQLSRAKERLAEIS